jgi:hypothetical protein
MKMKTLTNPEEFCRIHLGGKTFMSIENNFAMRQFINSYGFRATRELATLMFSMRSAT